MTSIRKIPGSSHQQNDRELAQDLYEKNSFEKALEILRRYSLDEMELSTRFLMGKIHLKLRYFTEAKLYLERVFSEDRKNKQVLRLLIETHNCLHEYQLVLFYLNHLFKLDGDVSEDIQNVLKLYRELGLYDRAIELQETMDQNEFFHEDYLEEKVLLALELENQQLALKVQKQNKELLRRKPNLQRSIRRLQRDVPYLGVRRRLYLQWGKILLGTNRDNGLNEDPIYSNFSFDLSCLYETFLRFFDLCAINHIKFSSVRAVGAEYDYIAMTLSQILGVPLLSEQDQNRRANFPTLNLYSTWNEKYLQQNGVHFALIVSKKHLRNPNQLPDFIGVVTNEEQSSEEVFNGTIPRCPERLFALMSKEKHISSMSFEARESMFCLQDLNFQKTSDIRISRLPGFHHVPRRRPWDYAYLRESLQQDGLLYSNSLLQTHGQGTIPKSQVLKILNVCKDWHYSSSKVLKYCHKVQPDLTMDFILSDLSESELNLRLLPNIDHVDILPILQKLMQKDEASLLLSGAWINLVFDPNFESWLENKIKDINNVEYLLKGFLDIVELNNFKWEWLSLITTKIKSENNWSEWARIVLRHMSQSPVDPEVVKVKLNKCRFLSEEIFELMRKLQVEPNKAQIKWILRSLKSHRDLCTRVIQNFGLLKTLKEILINQESNPTSVLINYSCLTKDIFQSLTPEINRLIPQTEPIVQAELYGFILIHAKDHYRVLDQLFNTTELKLIMRKQLTKFFASSEDISSERDLLFLMEQDEAGRIATAQLLVFQGDMEFYMYLVHRFGSHGNEFGLQIFKTLFECRADHAIEMLIQWGMIAKKINFEGIRNILNYINHDQIRKDEWQTFLKDSSNSALRTTLKCWLEQNFKESPDFLIIYLNTFVDEHLEATIDKFINLKDYNIQHLVKIKSLNPSKTQEILQRLDRSSLTRYLLENDWKKDLN